MIIRRDVQVRRNVAFILSGSLVLFLFLLAGNTRAAHEYPIMQPGVDTFHGWVNAYNSAPVAAIDPVADLRIRAGALAGIGSSFSLLDSLVYTPSERDQGYCGNCWVWAGTALLELALANTGVYDRLSIQYFDSCASLDCTDSGCGVNASCACAGGDLEMFVAAYNAIGNAIPWSNTDAPYQDSTYEDECGAAITCASITKSPSYVLNDEITESKITTLDVDQDTAIGNIKNVLQQNKGVFIIFTLPNTTAWNDFYDFWDDKSEADLWDFSDYAGKTLDFNNGAGSHAVLLVGYNEADTDHAKHYWIAVNSWGTTTNRTDGTFRIKMYQDYDSTYVYSYHMIQYTSPVMQFETVDDVSFTDSITTDPSADVQISSGAYSGTINIIAVPTRSWTATFDATWISITSSASDTGTGQIAFSASANTGSEARTAQLSINDEAFIQIIQAGAVQQGSSDKPTDSGGSSGGGGGMCFISTVSIS